jgi:hypothetical protein
MSLTSDLSRTTCDGSFPNGAGFRVECIRIGAPCRHHALGEAFNSFSWAYWVSILPQSWWGPKGCLSILRRIGLALRSRSRSTMEHCLVCQAPAR